MNKIRWGIVGAGNIAKKFAVAVKNVDCAELVAIGSRTKEKGEAFAEAYGIENVFDSYEAMASSDKVDAVYIATPHPMHVSCALLFLEAKKHVLCEKPLCVNAAQAIKLKESANRNGVFLMEAMWTRFLPAIKEIQGLIAEGAIGEVSGIKADFCYASTYDEDRKIYRNDMAGGSLLDVGVYGLHFSSIFLGEEPEEISSMAKIGHGVDLHTNVLLKYKNGAISYISSAVDLYKPSDAYIYGTKGYIYVPTFYGAKDFYLCKGSEKLHIEKPSIGVGFEEEIYEVCHCIAAGKTESDVLPLDKTVKILSQMDLIRKQIGLEYPFDFE
ncbi:MAG: Gfo/Idh/MocA family oxidoreductase [Ruminococcaceae bacterium]|nr:Gfo/Idh/MocA family oxidoreductase [Oscillospiraceae bacterium]